jgi:hypothetical protein
MTMFGAESINLCSGYMHIIKINSKDMLDLVRDTAPFGPHPHICATVIYQQLEGRIAGSILESSVCDNKLYCSMHYYVLLYHIDQSLVRVTRTCFIYFQPFPAAGVVRMGMRVTLTPAKVHRTFLSTPQGWS